MSIDYLKIIYDKIVNDNFNIINFQLYNKNEKEFYWNFNKILNKNDIPEETTHLIFGDIYNKPLKNIPHNIIFIKFGNKFNKSLKSKNLPKYLQHIEFGSKFNKDIYINSIPCHVKTLIFGDDFNKPLRQGTLPQSLKYLEFGFSFDQEILENVLPKCLNCLIFGELFNQNLFENIIPKSVNRLHFKNEEYNKTLDKNLNLIELMINKYFKGFIPNNILCIIKFDLIYDNQIEYDDETIHDFYEYNIGNNIYIFNYEDHEKIQNYIKDFENIKTNLFFEELVSKVFSPKRLLNISNKYNIESIKLCDIY